MKYISTKRLLTGVAIVVLVCVVARRRYPDHNPVHAVLLSADNLIWELFYKSR